MRFRLLGLLLLFLSLGSCARKIDKDMSAQSVSTKKLKIDTSALNTYPLPSNVLIDSLLQSKEAFTDFRNSIEDLSKLNPRGLTPFLYNALVTTDKLLNTFLPPPFETPAIRSRLKVVKTQLLRVSYFSTEQNYEALNKGLIELYEAYNAYLRRIEDFAQPTLIDGEKNWSPQPKLE